MKKVSVGNAGSYGHYEIVYSGAVIKSRKISVIDKYRTVKQHREYHCVILGYLLSFLAEPDLLFRILSCHALGNESVDLRVGISHILCHRRGADI